MINSAKFEIKNNIYDQSRITDNQLEKISHSQEKIIKEFGFNRAYQYAIYEDLKKGE